MQTRLARTQEKLAQAEARYQAVSAAEATKNRKMDTRRKIIIGGAIMAMVESDERASELLNLIVSRLKSDRDKALFDVGA